MHHGANEQPGADEKNGECCKGPADRKHHRALVLHFDRRAAAMATKGKRKTSNRRTTATGEDGDEFDISGRRASLKTARDSLYGYTGPGDRPLIFSPLTEDFRWCGEDLILPWREASPEGNPRVAYPHSVLVCQDGSRGIVPFRGEPCKTVRVRPAGAPSQRGRRGAGGNEECCRPPWYSIHGATAEDRCRMLVVAFYSSDPSSRVSGLQSAPEALVPSTLIS